MKSYLSLIPISAKVHRHRNRMTLICIIIAVFLVTAVFSMADMALRLEKTRMIEHHGNWHVMLKNIEQSDAELVGARPDVAAAAWYDAINYDLAEDYFIGGKRAVLCGADESYITDIMNCLTEGRYPQNDGEILLTDNVRELFGISIGGRITVNTPSDSIEYTVSGFGGDAVFTQLSDSVGAFMNMTALRRLCGTNDNVYSEPEYYVRFGAHVNVKKSIADIKEQYGWSGESISENTALLGLTGFSSDSYMIGLYGIAAVLFLLILMAGVFMIASSMNSNIAQRSQFFGMLRCIGADRKQIIRFVRLEALNWCKTAVPMGAVLGIVITWGICAVLRSVSTEFAGISVFGISTVGIVCGIVVGILTVLLAAQAPAKRASRVSPVAGSSGNAKQVRHAAYTRLCKIDTALGVHHAVSAKKNLILMTGSFALSIILFLCFSAFLDWVEICLPAMRPSEADCAVISKDNSCSVDKALPGRLSGMPGVERAFGNMARLRIPAESGRPVEQINLVSYEKNQFDWAKEDVVRGNVTRVQDDSNYVLTVFNRSNPLEVGDKVRFGGAEVEVAGILPYGPFGDDITLICSEKAFARLTGETGYAMVSIQMRDSAAEEDIAALRNFVGDDYLFTDYRRNNMDGRGTYWMFTLLAYGFLAVIALIAVFNVVNSISMSVSAKTKQYGTMRAVGMSGRQITKMIAVETGTYVLCGCAAGFILGLPLNRLVFEGFITAHFGDPWQFPILAAAVVILLVAVSSIAAVYAPAKRIVNMAVTDTINDQ